MNPPHLKSVRLSAIPGTPQYAKRLRERKRGPLLAVRVPKPIYQVVRLTAIEKNITIAEWLRRAILAYIMSGSRCK